jgi:hypothetical protein
MVTMDAQRVALAEVEAMLRAAVTMARSRLRRAGLDDAEIKRCLPEAFDDVSDES